MLEILAAGLSVLLPGFTSGANYADPVFTVMNSGGTTLLSESVFTKSVGGVEEASSYAEFTAATSGTLVKRGSGRVTISEAHGGFTGDVHVEEGVLACQVFDGLGASSSGAIYVHAGATLYMDPQSGTDLSQGGGRKLVIEGEGVTDLGAALYARYGSSADDSNWPFQKNLTLSGDSALAAEVPSRYLFESWWHWTDVAGHTLRLKGVVKTRPQLQLGSTFKNLSTEPGSIIADNLQIRLKDGVTFTGNSENTFVITNKTKLIFDTVSTGSREWTLRVDDLQSVDLYQGNASIPDASATDPAFVPVNKWEGPVELNTDLKLRKWDEPSKRLGLTLSGPISGSGGIKAYNSDLNSKQLVLRLANGGNTFSGGVSLNASSLFLGAGTALPANGGDLTLTNGTLGLSVAGAFTLPSCAFDGEGQILGVAGSSATSAHVTKTGAGVLSVARPLNVQKLEVKEGTYRQSSFSWEAAAGLKEYMHKYSNGSEARASYNAGATGLDYRGVESTLAATTMNGSAWGTEAEAQYKVFAYHGYVWNRGTEDVTWTIASAADDGATLLIDGVKVVDNTKYNVKTGQVTLTPGAHAFEYRIWNDAGYRGALDKDIIRTFNGESWSEDKTAGVAAPVMDSVTHPELGAWHANRGLRYKVGDLSKFDVDYAAFVDSGDGSLFTTTTNATDLVAFAPQYGEVVFAAGTTFDLNGWMTPVTNLKGQPTVANGDLIVNGTWTIRGGENAMDVSGELIFGDTASIAVENAASLPKSDIVVARATKGVTIPEGWRGVSGEAQKLWKVKKTSDTELSLVRIPGFILVFR